MDGMQASDPSDQWQGQARSNPSCESAYSRSLNSVNHRPLGRYLLVAEARSLREVGDFVSSENGFGWRRGSLVDESPVAFGTVPA